MNCWRGGVCGVWVGALMTAMACANDGGGPDPGPPDSGVERCLSPMMCDDGFDCTVDSCNASGVCEHTPVPERCAMGETCEVGSGCVAGVECMTAADCDDSVECTLEVCVVGNVCEHMPIHERCTEPGNTCDVTMGCVGPTGCESEADCDDSFDCTVDTCGAARLCAHEPIDARCGTDELCSPSAGCTRPCTMDDECEDGDFCNGRELCDPEFGCGPAAAPRMCADADPCTLDACDTAANMCTFACNTADPTCMCPTMMPDYNGVFDIMPAIVNSCGDDGMGGLQVDYNIMSMTFTYTPALLSVEAGVPRVGAASSLTQIPAPTGPDFNINTVVAGTCEERYSLIGTFTDPDTFTAMWSATYVETTPFGCLLIFPPCSNQSIMVTGTRR